MKYQIKKMEAGGAMVATYTPMARNDSSAPIAGSRNRNDKDSESSDDMPTVIDKETYKRLITEGGLVNDVDHFVDKLSKINRSSKLPFLQNTNISSSLENIKELNRIQQNKALWQTTYNTAKSLGGLDEVAVGKQGEVFVKDGDTFKAISLGDYDKHRNKYNPLTVSELLRARQYDPNLVNNDSVFQVGETANGMTEILTKVDNIIKLVGEHATKEESHYSRTNLESELASLGAIKAPTKEQKTKLVELARALQTPGDQFKEVNDVASKSMYTNTAYNYILSALTREEANKLRAVATINGQSVDKLLQNALATGLSGGHNTHTFEGEKPVETEESVRAKGTNSSERPLTTFELQNNGDMLRKDLNWNDPKTGLKMGLAGNTVELWDNFSSNTRVKLGPLKNLLDSNTGALLDKTKIYYGDKEVGLSDQLNIIVDPTGGSARVYFPVNSDGSPNYNYLQQVEDIKKKLDPKATSAQIEEAYQKAGLAVKPFLLAYGFADDKAMVTDGNEQIKKLSGVQEDEVAGALSAIYDAMKMEKPTGIFHWDNHYWKGNILIPYSENSSAIAASMAGNVTAQRTSIEEVKIHSNLDQARFINASSDLFNKK